MLMKFNTTRVILYELYDKRCSFAPNRGASAIVGNITKTPAKLAIAETATQFIG
jgi:hypothetical protein